MQFCIQVYVMIFGRLFHIYKLIHIDIKPVILKASFLWASLTNNQCKWLFLFFELGFFKKENKTLLHRVIVQNETLINITWIWCSNIFMILRLKCLHDNLNIVVILAARCAFFSAKCAQFPLTFRECT